VAYLEIELCKFETVRVFDEFLVERRAFKLSKNNKYFVFVTNNDQDFIDWRNALCSYVVQQDIW
jgi:hypothetical protein